MKRRAQRGLARLQNEANFACLPPAYSAPRKVYETKPISHEALTIKIKGRGPFERRLPLGTNRRAPNRGQKGAPSPCDPAATVRRPPGKGVSPAGPGPAWV